MGTLNGHFTVNNVVRCDKVNTDNGLVSTIISFTVDSSAMADSLLLSISDEQGRVAEERSVWTIV